MDNGRLEHLNLKGNKIDKLEELKKLAVFAGLKTLVVSGNAAFDRLGESWVLEVLPTFRRLDRINKTTVNNALLEVLWNAEKDKWEQEVEREREREREHELAAAKEKTEEDESK